MDARGTKDATCGVCGCTDSMACSPPCCWDWVDRRRGIGLCSRHGTERGEVPGPIRALLMRKAQLLREASDLELQERKIVLGVYHETRRVVHSW